MVQAWNNAGAYLRCKNCVANPIIRIAFELKEVSSGAYFPVDVEKARRREWIGFDINVWERTDVSTLTHELGHVFGNYDEYGGSGVQAWLERRMYWHDNRFLDDYSALMNEGREFRARFFDHFARYVNQHFAGFGAKYQVNLK